MLNNLVKSLRKINGFVGLASVCAVGISAAVGVSAFGAASLAKGGVPGFSEDATKTANIAWGGVLLGTVAICGTSAIGFALSEVEEKVSTAVRCPQFVEIPLEETVDNEEVESNHELVVDNNLAEVEFVKNSSVQVSAIERLASSYPSVYSYRFMQYVDDCDRSPKLVVCRFEEEPYRKLCVYDEVDSNACDKLMVIYDIPTFSCDEDKLVGKTFTSYKSSPKEALEEHLAIYQPWVDAVESNDFDSDYLKSCAGCRFLHGENGFVCNKYSEGWEGYKCPDKQWDERKVLYAFEDDARIARLNDEFVGTEITIYKGDDRVLIWDDYTNRRYEFSFAGVLLKDSDKIPDLGEHARFLSYVHYFRCRNLVVKYDYVKSGRVYDIFKDLQGIAEVEVNLCRQIIIIREFKTREIGCTHEFRFDGIALHPYSSMVPKQLQYTYNLVTLSAYLKKNFGTVVSLVRK
jgi:hypothetical protein